MFASGRSHPGFGVWQLSHEIISIMNSESVWLAIAKIIISREHSQHFLLKGRSSGIELMLCKCSCAWGPCRHGGWSWVDLGRDVPVLCWRWPDSSSRVRKWGGVTLWCACSRKIGWHSLWLEGPMNWLGELVSHPKSGMWPTRGKHTSMPPKPWPTSYLLKIRYDLARLGGLPTCKQHNS